MANKNEKTIEQQVNDNTLYLLKEFKNKDVKTIISFIRTLSPDCREYGYKISDDIILANKSPVFTIPELVIIAGQPKVLLSLTQMGYDLNKKYYKPTGTFFYNEQEYSFKEGNYPFIATFLNREDGHFQVKYLIKENYINISNEDLADCIENSFIRGSLSVALNNLSSLLPDNANIGQRLSDISFFTALGKIFSQKKEEGKIQFNHVFLYTQFLEFIYPYISFEHKDELQQKQILSTLTNMEEYNHCRFYNRIITDFPQYKQELSEYMIRKLGGFLQYKDKEAQEKKIIHGNYDYISAIITNPLVYLNEQKNASLLNKEQINVLIDQILKHNAFHDYAYILKNTRLLAGYHIIEHLNSHSLLDPILKEGLINLAYMNNITEGKKIKKEEFIKPNNFFFNNENEAFEGIKRKLEKDLLGSNITVDSTTKTINRL